MIQYKASRDIWSHGSGTQLSDLIGSSLSTLLLLPKTERPIYLSSPWISDFPLLRNQFKQFSSLFPHLDARADIRFSDVLQAISERMPVRIVTVSNEVSKSFVDSTQLRICQGISTRFAPEVHHEKGILTNWFYIEGSMNITFHGVHIRGEKITYHTASSDEGREKIARAYLEFDRYWRTLDAG
jgi:hypothetical protein